MAQPNTLTCLGWTCSIEAGTKHWSKEDHSPTTTGTLWWRQDKITVHRPSEAGGDKKLDGFVQVKEVKNTATGRLQTVTSAHYKDKSVAVGQFGLLSFVKWLLEQNGIAPKSIAKNYDYSSDKK